MLVRFRIRGSVPLTNGSISDSFLKDAKKLPVGTLSTVLKIYIFDKIKVKIVFCKHYLILFNTFRIHTFD
jgi:hypothetical protein